ncbi:MAG: NAD-glutamate dehydrogenase [Ilumatobacteraceae bacterium]
MGQHTGHGNGVESLTERLTALARSRRPDDELLAEFVASYYRELLDFDLDERHDADLYSAAVRHWSMGQQRSSGDTEVLVLSPDRERDGWHSSRSLVLIVTDDVPFLVDTVRMVLERHGVATHLLVHPMLRIRRDETGAAVAINATGVADGASTLEAWSQVEIDRCEGQDATALHDDLVTAVDTAHRVVSDFEPMRDRLLAHALLDPLLGWLADGNFVFMGASSFEIVDGALTRNGDRDLGQSVGDDVVDPAIDLDAPPVSVARSAQSSTVHRPSRLTVVTVRYREDGRELVDRFVGLLASTAYRQSTLTIPSVGERAREVLGLATAGAETHTGRSMRNVLETLPRDVVFELDADQLAALVIEVVGLQERQIVRVIEVPEPVGAWSTVLVFVPKTRFTADLPDLIGRFVGAAYGSSIRDLESFVGASNLARITFTVERAAGDGPDLDDLSDQVDQLTTSWTDRLKAAATRELGDGRAHELLERFGDAVPESYRTSVDPDTAVGDVVRLDELLASDEPISAALTRSVDADEGVWRMRVYSRGEAIALSDLLPLLGHLGVQALDEHPHRLDIDGGHCYVYDIGLRIPASVTVDEHRHREVTSAFVGLLAGEIEADGFNRLVLLAGLTTWQVNVLRCYAKYAHQTSFTFSQAYVEDTLARLPNLATLLVELFEARFDPDLDDGERLANFATADDELLTGLDDVPSLDDDRIVRMFRALVTATVRTSAYLPTPTLAFKFDPSKVPDLPAPRPAHEIFVCSRRVEGVHLRGGAIARGGLRWSDRPEDYRTEVLGLVKAQMVKNAVIVPVGAKGGFVVKQPGSNPEEQRAEGVECYRMFVRGLLDLTDNLVGATVVHPERVVRYDRDDPYLVVAADKGTATFSDTANAISAEYDFWLGDAFASGGSAGYDHKAMGITARGAWESVRRHASVLGRDADVESMIAVGIGDMSGDVFGNGMLISRHLRLVAAFDHRDIFLDPDPDAASSWTERKRLFDLARSSWSDYDRSLISEGGGVFSRQLKSIELSPQVQRALGVTDDSMTPNQLISAILRAPVDLLWNGGVGTYVKASSETDGDVGDRTNDAVRVDASTLRCRMVGEGGNLGVTQLGRVEYAIGGGLLYTDAIDNSAGVDCSDHEVNIKVLLGGVVASGDMTLKQRNVLLEEMTDEVAELVLDNNKQQTLALMIAREQGLTMVNVHARYLDQLESEGWLDRGLEFLPTDKQIAERQLGGSGLRTPEFAVMIAYTKNANVSEILATDLPDAPVLEQDLVEYFPTPLRERFHDEILGHRLHREIATTQLVNEMVNISGISYDHRMTEDTGASVTDVARAWLVAREVLGFDDWWHEIDALTSISNDDRLELYLDCRRSAERASLWFLRHRRPPLDIAGEVARFREPSRNLGAQLDDCLSGPMKLVSEQLATARTRAGVPVALAERSSNWRLLHMMFDMIELADRIGVDPVLAGTTYWQVFDRLDLMWLWDAVASLPRSDRWQTQARGALRDDLMTTLAELASSVLNGGGGSVEAWIVANERAVQRVMALLTEVRRADTFDVTNLSVALRQLKNLALTSRREP